MRGTQVSRLKQSTSQLHHVVKDGKILSRSRRVISVTRGANCLAKIDKSSRNRDAAVIASDWPPGGCETHVWI